jgi:plasmid stabilization system protein ParE
MARLLRREAAKRDLIAHFVYLSENASTEVAERFLLAAEQAAKSMAQMPEIGIPGKVRRGKYAGVRIWPSLVDNRDSTNTRSYTGRSKKEIRSNEWFTPLKIIVACWVDTLETRSVRRKHPTASLRAPNLSGKI